MRGGQALAVLDCRAGARPQHPLHQQGQLDSAQFAAARAAGLDEARMLEVVANLAWMTLSNCLNGLAETRIDFPA